MESIEGQLSIFLHYKGVIDLTLNYLIVPYIVFVSNSGCKSLTLYRSLLKYLGRSVYVSSM